MITQSFNIQVKDIIPVATSQQRGLKKIISSVPYSLASCSGRPREDNLHEDQAVSM